MSYPIRGLAPLNQSKKLFLTQEAEIFIKAYGPNFMLKSVLTQGSSCVYPLWPNEKVEVGEVCTIRHLTKHVTLVVEIERLFYEEQWNGLATAYGPCAARRKGYPMSAPTHGCVLKVIGVQTQQYAAELEDKV
jgi:hypothetical protein